MHDLTVVIASGYLHRPSGFHLPLYLPVHGVGNCAYGNGRLGENIVFHAYIDIGISSHHRGTAACRYVFISGYSVVECTFTAAGEHNIHCKIVISSTLMGQSGKSSSTDANPCTGEH